MKINKILLTCTAVATLLNFQAHASNAAAPSFEDFIQGLRTQNQASQAQIQELTTKLAAADQLNARLQAQLQEAPNKHYVAQLFLAAIDQIKIGNFGLANVNARGNKYYDVWGRVRPEFVETPLIDIIDPIPDSQAIAELLNINKTRISIGQELPDAVQRTSMALSEANKQLKEASGERRAALEPEVARLQAEFLNAQQKLKDYQANRQQRREAILSMLSEKPAAQAI